MKKALLFICLSFVGCKFEHVSEDFKGGTEGKECPDSKTGEWTGQFNWNCSEVTHGSSEITFNLHDDCKGHLTGTVVYFGETLEVEGGRHKNPSRNRYFNRVAKNSPVDPEGKNIALRIKNPDKNDHLNTLSGTLSEDGKTLTGYALNGPDCSKGGLPSQHSGEFEISLVELY